MLNSIYSKEEVLKRKFPKPDPVKDPDEIILPTKTENKFSSTGGSTSDEWINNQSNANISQVDAASSLVNTATSGTDWGGAVSGAISLAGDVMARENSAPQTEKESNMSALKMGVSGAALGASVAGPWGAAVGFVAGTGYGLIKGNSDSKKLVKQARTRQQAYLAQTTQQREIEQRLEEGQKEIGKLKALYQSQLGINP